MGEGSLLEVVVLLGAAVVLVPIAKRFGFGMVLGYLGAGLVIGPWALGLVADVENIKRIAEFGVVFLLFVIGLELQPSRLWALRQPIFGYGSAQGLITAAIVIGLALSLSSTAFALQLLAERKELTTRHGRMAFSILLFQDLAAIPMIAIVPLLAAMPGQGAGAASMIDAAALVKAAAIIAVVIVGGRYVLQPLFRIVAATGIQELFTAAALLVVIGIS